VVAGRGTPIRRGATTDQAGHNDLIAMAQDTGSADFGRAAVRIPWQEALDVARVAAFLAAQGQPVDPRRPDEGVLAGHGLLRREEARVYPTAAAVLLFGRRPQTYFPQATLSLVRLAGSAADPVDSAVASGTVLEQIERAEAFVRRNVAGEYPIEVVREAIVNALMHRDYRAEEVEVSVRLIGDRIEVVNPGVLVGGLELTDVAQGDVDHPPRRNPTLVSLFFDQARRPAGGVPYIERAGSGIRRMRERLAARRLPLPEFREDEVRRLFRVTLLGVPLRQPGSVVTASQAGLSPRQRRLLDEISPGDSMSAAEYQDRYQVSRRTATADLTGLVGAGLLEAVGSGAGRRYRRPGDAAERGVTKAEASEYS
jgi:ATP-dependent DNA helicase RecG